MSRINVQGFPTILVFGADKDTPTPYDDARTASAIESFALEQLESNTALEVSELTSPDVMEEKCLCCHLLCFILAGHLGHQGRRKEQILGYVVVDCEDIQKKSLQPYSIIWTAAGKQLDLEKQVGVGGYGYPAMIALSSKKGAYAPLKSAFELDHIVEFVKEAGLGGKGNFPMSATPKIETIEAWDGKDGKFIEEDEFSLDELLKDDTETEDDTDSNKDDL